jgi:hypothetical protein
VLIGPPSRLRLVPGPVAPGPRRLSLAGWIAGLLQAGALVAGCVLWPAPPQRPVSTAVHAHPAAPAAPLVYGPPLPAQVAAASLLPGRVTPYPPASIQVLMSAGDRAQLVGHPRQAVGFYDQILRENPGDPRAAEAAFISGRLLLHALDRPRQAAERFAQARRLAPHGPMAEDALAQEIASWARAGHTARARARAEEFRALYPSAPLPELIDVQGG